LKEKTTLGIAGVIVTLLVFLCSGRQAEAWTVVHNADEILLPPAHGARVSLETLRLNELLRQQKEIPQTKHWVQALRTERYQKRSRVHGALNRAKINTESLRHSRLLDETSFDKNLDSLRKYDIPMTKHPWVQNFIRYFTGPARKHFQIWLNRLAVYAPIMQPILQKHGLPKDTIYLAMIESGLSSRATSRVGAGGFWQFMPSTGKDFGLKRDKWRDQRRDFLRSTEASSKFLKKLKRDFGEWYLAWAAYNAGPGRVRRALKRTKTKTFWKLAEHPKGLPRETRHYVPKLLAAAMIAKDPTKYGFKVNPLPPLPKYETFETHYSIGLTDMARWTGYSHQTLKRLNPELKTDQTPPYRYKLRLPLNSKHLASAGLEKWEALRIGNYRVKRGDSLFKIARKFKTTISELRELNPRLPKKLLHVSTSLRVPNYHITKNRVTKSKANRIKFYNVRSGDTFWSIAKRFATTVRSLKELNRRKSSSLRIGEQLRLF